jgi:CubicO group peptidase (beta-lactamase class C family)
MKRLLQCLLLVVVPIAPLRAMEPAASLRMSEAGMASAEAYSRRCGGLAFLVLQGGRTVRESYAHGGAPDRPIHVMSLTKNLAALAVLAASADGFLKLDEPVSKTISEWRGQPGKRDITIRQLLTQTSGLATGYETIYARNVRDKNRIAVALPLVSRPGGSFRYSPGNYELIEEILRRKLASRHTDPLAYLTGRVLAPIGVRPSPNWRRDRAGNPFFSAGAHLTARDVAKIGEFVRNRGRAWLLPVIPAGAFDGVFDGTAANPMYGESFWLNATVARADARPISIEGTIGAGRSAEEWGRSCASSSAPPDLIAMVGSGGERCYIVPSRKLVVVRFGDGSAFSDAEFLRRLFSR